MLRGGPLSVVIVCLFFTKRTSNAETAQMEATDDAECVNANGRRVHHNI